MGLKLLFFHLFLLFHMFINDYYYCSNEIGFNIHITPIFVFVGVSAEKACLYKSISGPRSFAIAMLFNFLKSLLVTWQKLLSDISFKLFLMVNQWKFYYVLFQFYLSWWKISLLICKRICYPITMPTSIFPIVLWLAPCWFLHTGAIHHCNIQETWVRCMPFCKEKGSCENKKKNIKYLSRCGNWYLLSISPSNFWKVRTHM